MVDDTILVLIYKTIVEPIAIDLRGCIDVSLFKFIGIIPFHIRNSRSKTPAGGTAQTTIFVTK